jgi:hypothetical protein
LTRTNISCFSGQKTPRYIPSPAHFLVIASESRLVPASGENVNSAMHFHRKKPHPEDAAFKIFNHEIRQTKATRQQH